MIVFCVVRQGYSLSSRFIKMRRMFSRAFVCIQFRYDQYFGSGTSND